MGYVWVTPGPPPSPHAHSPARRGPPRDRGVLLLRNEHFEAWISPATGCLAALKDYNSRHNRLSQQLAFRASGSGKRLAYTDAAASEEYSVVAADSVEVARATTAVGEIVARGRLLNRRQEELARFRQSYRAWRGSRVLQLEIELEPRAEPGAEPWDSYYACRFAWPTRRRSCREACSRCGALPGREDSRPATTWRSPGAGANDHPDGGLPYHRRVGHRMLDTLLLVRESENAVFGWASAWI